MTPLPTPNNPLHSDRMPWSLSLIVSERKPLPDIWSGSSFFDPFWRLYVNEQPGVWLDLEDGSRFRLPKRTICLVPAWCAFTGRFNAKTTPILQNYLHFECLGLPPNLQRFLFSRPIRLQSSPGLNELIQQWQNASLSVEESIGARTWALALIHAAMGATLDALPVLAKQEYQRWQQDSGEMAPILAYIEQNLSTPLTNTKLANLCHRSCNHFIRLFNKSLGMTPMQYVLERRVTIGAVQLAQTRLSVEEIAAATGFTDRFHFSRSFKHRFNLPPVAYRRLFQAS